MHWKYNGSWLQSIQSLYTVGWYAGVAKLVHARDLSNLSAPGKPEVQNCPNSGKPVTGNPEPSAPTERSARRCRD
jgi:hypothetical protein